MKILRSLLLLLVLVGGLAWYYRDSLPFGSGSERVEVSLEAAEIAEGKLDRMIREGEPARLSSVEVSSLLRFRATGWTPDLLHDPRVLMAGDTIRVLATVPVDQLPSQPDLDRVRALLPDSVEVEVSGSIRSIGTDRAALNVRRVEFAGIPIPERYFGVMLERFGRRAEDGLAPTEMAVPLPPGVKAIGVEDGYLVLTP